MRSTERVNRVDMERFNHLPLLIPISVVREFTGLSVTKIQTLKDENGELVFKFFKPSKKAYKKYYKADLAKFCRIKL